MNEVLLHFIWKFRLFNNSNLKTTEGEKIEVLNAGTHNTDAGADFTNAKIRIGKTTWAGNVEMHVNSDDWFLHRHQNNGAYSNVILHVVYEQGKKIAANKSGEKIPTLVLKKSVNETTLSRYEELSKRKTWIPCEKFFPSVDLFTLKNYLERLLIERLENKVEHINHLLSECGNDWEQVMFQLLARYLGAGVNKEAFELLAKNISVKVFSKQAHEPLQIEAMLFGVAGFLQEKFNDDYPNQLRKEFNYQRRLHNLNPLEKHQWKFLRLRPSNFPTLRLAQLSSLVIQQPKLFSAILETKYSKQLRKVFDADVSPYWSEHYVFDKPAKNVRSHLGDSMKNILLINAVAPVLFAYGKYKNNEDYCERSIQLLEECEAESNAIIKGWKNLSVKPENAYETQALLQLKTEYCSKFRCLECAIGHKILK